MPGWTKDGELYCFSALAQRQQIFYSLPNMGTTYKDALNSYSMPKANIVTKANNQLLLKQQHRREKKKKT